jgi:hypothetical protein
VGWSSGCRVVIRGVEWLSEVMVVGGRSGGGQVVIVVGGKAVVVRGSWR